MKATTSLVTLLAAAAFAISPLAVYAQDDQGAAPPPPPMDQGAPPPPDQDQSAPPPPDQGGDNSGASFDDFYNNLSSQGSWVQTPDYGYVFQPQVEDPDWAPYTDGHWVYTDYGWTWASDEPWGWATYHYGRWVNIVGTGWVWVPGYQWAPAWVSWRYGGGYCGWAPLPPSTFVGVEFGGNLGLDFHFGSDVDVNFGIGPGCYNFIPIGYIGERRYHGYYANRGQNYTIINRTTNITNIYVSRNPGNAFSAVRVQGPALAEVNAQAHTPVQQVRLTAARQAGPGSLSGGTFSVYAPHINPATAHTARPASVSRTLSSVTVNRGTSVSQPLQVNSHLKPVAPPASVIAEAKAAQAKAPMGVATASRIKSTARLSRPLTAMPTTAEQRRETTPAATSTYHPAAAATEQHPASSVGNSEAEHNAEVQHAQQEKTEQAQEQERQSTEAQQQREAAAAQQQREAQSAAQERAAAEQRAAQEQAPAYHPQQQETQQHYQAPSQPQAQHYQAPSQPQAQHYQPQPQAQHPQGSGNQNKNGQNNGQNQYH